ECGESIDLDLVDEAGKLGIVAIEVGERDVGFCAPDEIAGLELIAGVDAAVDPLVGDVAIRSDGRGIVPPHIGARSPAIADLRAGIKTGPAIEGRLLEIDRRWKIGIARESRAGEGREQ